MGSRLISYWFLIKRIGAPREKAHLFRCLRASTQSGIPANALACVTELYAQSKSDDLRWLELL